MVRRPNALEEPVPESFQLVDHVRRKKEWFWRNEPFFTGKQAGGGHAFQDRAGPIQLDGIQCASCAHASFFRARRTNSSVSNC